MDRPARPEAERALKYGIAAVAVGVVVLVVLVGMELFGAAEPPKTQAELLLVQGREAVESDPASATAHLDLGSAYFEIGDYDGALEEFEKAGALDENTEPKAIYNLGHVYRAMGKHADAVAQFEKVVRFEDRTKAPNMKKMSEEEKAAVKARLLTTDFIATARFWLATEQLEIDRTADALETIEPLLEMPIPDASALKLAAKAHERLGAQEKAREYYEKVLQYQPGDTEAREGVERTK